MTIAASKSTCVKERNRLNSRESPPWPYLVKILERPAGQQFAPFHGSLESAMRLGSTSSTMTTRGIIKARRICFCSQPATSYLSPSTRCAPVNGLAGRSVSTTGKPHEYFDLTAR